MPETQGALISIVEDDPGIALLQQRHLERAGYTTRAAAVDRVLQQVRTERR